MDWKATARARKLLARIFDPSPTVNVVIAVAVDTREPYWGIDDTEDLDRMITVAASVANHVAERDYSFGLFSNNMAVHVNRSMRVPVGQGREQFGEVMGALATIPAMAVGPMADHLAEQGPRFPLGTTVVLCTALITEAMVATLDVLAHARIKLVVMYVDHVEPPELPDRVLIYSMREHLVRMESAARSGDDRINIQGS